jgi:hypothetical protein
MSSLRRFSQRAISVFSVVTGLGLPFSVAHGQNFKPATAAFDSPGCNGSDLGDVTDISRGNPEWKAIVIDSAHPLPNNPPTILEGFVAFPPANEKSSDQAPAEVSEEELPWNHYTHDFTFKVIPDPPYQNLLASWNRFPGVTLNNVDPLFCKKTLGGVSGDPLAQTSSCTVPPEVCPDLSTGATCHHTQMEVEWENGSAMKVNSDDDRTWGSVPEFVWPSSGDRVWLEGRWVFDCGHANVPPAAPESQYVKYDTEIHPPRALATFRLGHTALSTLGNPFFNSWLPVTGQPAILPPDQPNTGPTNVPVTEADIFVSGNGGGANDYCSLVADCPAAFHTGPVIDVSGRNYVFDIYPPGTDYLHPLPNGTFPVTPPVPDASLQWRLVDQSSQVPLHTCAETACVFVQPLFCPIDASVGPTPQDQSDTTTDCPAISGPPTRLRVILPFQQGVNLAFAQSILLGWDDVPTPANATLGVRNFFVTLHAYTVVQDAEGCSFSNGCFFPVHGDWRVFVDVGGQWRYMSPLYDANPDGSSVCDGIALTKNSTGDCFLFDQTPWLVSVQDGEPIHVAVGGFESDGVDGNFCTDFGGTTCSSGVHGFFDLAFENDDRLGTYEFDLQHQHDYQWTSKDGNTLLTQFTTDETPDDAQYKVEFTVREVPPPTPPASQSLQIGDPHFGNYVSSSTPFILSSADANVQGFQYRFRGDGSPLPVYESNQDIKLDIHWTHADLPANSQSVSLFLNGAGLADGPYFFQYSAQSFANLLEPRHTQATILDNTPPVATIVQPAGAQYGHSDSLTLDYSVSDGTGSGVKSANPKIDGLTAAQFGASLDPGQTIYLYSMPLGTHVFSVDMLDNVNNAGSGSATFSIVVTPDTLKKDVTTLQALGCIDGLGQSLIAKISAAQDHAGNGQIQAAVNTLQALIQQIEAQAGKHIATGCKDPNGRAFDTLQLLIGDIRYLQASLAGRLAANPIVGWVVNQGEAGISGVTVNLMSSSATAIATATTDATGFYYFADTSTHGLITGGQYLLQVTLPPGYSTSMPGSQTFTWSASSVLGNFVLD